MPKNYLTGIHEEVTQQTCMVIEYRQVKKLIDYTLKI